MKFKRIAIDISKHAFTLHGVDDAERPVLRRDLRRAEVETFFAKIDSTEVIMEACGGAHHWGRVLEHDRIALSRRGIPVGAEMWFKLLAGLEASN